MGNGMALGERMKRYEAVSKSILTMRMPKIIRIDGRSFHTYTRGMERPFDAAIYHVWCETAARLCQEIMGAKFAYFQSDECSILLTDYDELDTQAWFDNEVQKIVSVAASTATAWWNHHMRAYYPQKIATLDARVFVLPREEVANYFIWRQRDAIKNSISALAQAHFSPRQLHRLNGEAKQDLLRREKGIDWNHLPDWQKHGAVVERTIIEQNGGTRSRWTVRETCPIFSSDRTFVERLVYPDAEGAARGMS